MGLSCWVPDRSYKMVQQASSAPPDSEMVEEIYPSWIEMWLSYREDVVCHLVVGPSRVMLNFAIFDCSSSSSVSHCDTWLASHVCKSRWWHWDAIALLFRLSVRWWHWYSIILLCLFMYQWCRHALILLDVRISAETYM